MPKDEVEDLVQYMTDMKFLPGGRYIYYAGRDPETRYYNNCFFAEAQKMTTGKTGQPSLRRPPARHVRRRHRLIGLLSPVWQPSKANRGQG